MSYQMAMCTSCGEFVSAYDPGDGLEVIADQCPGCGNEQFRDTVSGRYLEP